MRRHIITLLALAGLFLPSSAETVSQKEAKRIATQFFNAAHGQVMAAPNLVYNGRRLTTGSHFPPFYVYNHPTGGYVIISAENKAFPILAYNLTDSFSQDDVVDTKKALLTLYAKHIENIRYDSQIPHEAIEAWGNLPQYIASILEAPYRATDPRSSKEEAKRQIEIVEDMENPAAYLSITYSPSQWTSLIDEELIGHGEVIMALHDGKALRPAIVYGRKGDYYKIELDERDNTLWRLLPTEIISMGEMATFYNPKYTPPAEPEEVPHKFYEDFLATVQAEAEAVERAGIDLALEPLIQGKGSGAYAITLAEPVVEARVYRLDGALIYRDKFRDTPVAHIDLSSQPQGFYVAHLTTASGNHYSFKLSR